MKITSSKIPENTIIKKYLPAGFSDCFLCTDSPEGISADDMMVAFWTTMPRWLSILFKIRDMLVSPFGLKTGKGNAEQMEEAIREGKNYRFMSVMEKSEKETVIVLDDKHLKAYFSTYIQTDENGGRSIYLSTLVKYHNRLGRVYFFVIRPFHTIVVKKLFRQVIRDKSI
ncbi:MAG: DUF2867 domain-containing protein [Bacteroidales bacterium]|jgi:hypothetical protein|nr:DUF2867 domain-containing protein [Bacteroidales bacterium]